MAVSNIIVKGIKPDLNILGNTQRFIFSDSTSYFGLRNDFVPTANIPSLVGFDFSNNSFSGFRFTYQTPFNQNLGSFKLKSYVNNDPVGTDIFTVNNNALTFNSAVDFAIAPLFNDPTQDLHAANKRFVDNHTWLVSSITNFDASVRSYKLNDFLAPTGNISLNNNTITSLANPVNSSDAANRAFVDSKTWTTSQITNFNAAVIAFRLDQFAIPNANLNLNNYRITGSGTPILSTDLTTKSFVESSITSGISGVPTAVTLTGDVTGSGNTGSSITTILNKRLDQITAPTSSVNLNSQKIINLATPVLSTDAATRGFIDGKTWTASQITDFDIQVRLSRLDQMALPTSSLNANSQKIINLAAPVLSTDGVNRNYADTSTIAPSRITGYPSSTTVFLRGDGTWAAGNSGTVTSVGISSGTGLSVSGSPITASGTINLSLTTELQTLSSLTATGLLSRNVSGTYSGRTITASTGISLSNGDGILGNPTISISTIPINNLSGYPANSSVFLRGDGTWNSIPTIDINNGTTNQLNISRLSGYPFNSTLFLRGDGQWATAGGGSASLASNSINVNTDGGSTNWLRRNINTVSGVQVYGLTSTSYILESSNGESAGIGFDGGTDNCTIWTAGDSGSYLNIQDEDSTNSRVAYVATNGAWTQVSSEKRKHSIKVKNNNNVLDRFLKLSIKSYGYKYEIKDSHTEKQKKRIEKKSNKMATGLILEELFKIFPNCIPDYYNKMFQDKRNKDLILEEELKEPENSGIDYNTLMCYFIMAFQEYVKKTDNLILDLQNKGK